MRERRGRVSPGAADGGTRSSEVGGGGRTPEAALLRSFPLRAPRTPFVPVASVAFLPVSVGEAAPGLGRWGTPTPGIMGLGCPAGGLPNSRKLWPGSDFHAGVLPGKRPGSPPEIRLPN